MKNKIRLAIIGNSKVLYEWEYSMLADLLVHPNIEVSHYFGLPKKEVKTKPFALTVFAGLERLLLRSEPTALRKKDVKDALPETPVILMNPVNDTQTISEKLRVEPVDYLINLIHGFTPDLDHSQVRSGILELYFGDDNKSASPLPGFLEMIKEKNTVISHLIIKKPEGKTLILDTVCVGTDRMSIYENTNQLVWAASRLIPRYLIKIAESNQGFTGISTREKPIVNGVNKDEITLTNSFIFSSMIKKYRRKIRQLRMRRNSPNQWILLFSFNSTPLNENLLFDEFRKIVPPADRFWADPFPYIKDGICYIFFEELTYSDKKGFLSVMTLYPDGSHSEPKVILKKDYHLSYPFLIEDGGELYMIPETSENKTIEIYQCVEFPNQWEFVKYLKKDVIAVDTTIEKIDGTYWMFTNIQENEGTSKNNELFLFYSDSLLSDQWQAHPDNPIVSDVTRARPAGNLIKSGNSWFRPSQDCSKFYGYAITLNRIEKLTKTDYHESKSGSYLPDWDPEIAAMHTINRKGDLTIIDGIKIKKKS